MLLKGLVSAQSGGNVNLLLLRFITRLSHEVTVRDHASRRYLREKCGFYDAQFRDDFALQSRVVKVSQVSGAVGVNLIPFGATIWFDQDQRVFDSYLDYMYQVFLALRAKGYTVYFLPVNTEHDNFAIDEFIERFGISKKQYVRDVVVTTSDLKTSISKCEFVICARLHACVISQLLGVRYIPLAYQDKVWDFCSQYKEDEMYRLATELNERKLLGVLNGM